MQSITLFLLLIGCLAITTADYEELKEIKWQLKRFIEDGINLIPSNDHKLIVLKESGYSSKSYVYTGRFDDAEEEVAVKFFTDKNSMDREITVYQALNATMMNIENEMVGIPKLYYAGTIKQTSYAFHIIVITLFDNNLHARWSNQRLQFNMYTTLQVFLQSAKALQYIHSKGFVHNDINPFNIFFRGNRVSVGDFDLATLKTECGDPSERSPGRYSSRALWKKQNGTPMNDLESLVFVIWGIEGIDEREPFGQIMNRQEMLSHTNINFVTGKCKHFKKFRKAEAACKFICEHEMLSGRFTPNYDRIFRHLEAAIAETGQKRFEWLPSTSSYRFITQTVASKLCGRGDSLAPKK